MYIRLTFNASGDDFNAAKCIDNLVSQELDVVFDSDFPGYLSFVHREGFSNEYYDEGYEKVFYLFVKNNIDALINYGADDFDIFIEVYAKEQCNFEVLNIEFLELVSKYKIRLPISVYRE